MQGIIYKTQPYLEHARLLFTYTEHGKITLIAQGAQKMNSAYRVLGQYLTKIEFVEQANKSMYSLKEGKLIEDYKNIKSDYQTLKSAALFLEIIDHMVYDDLNHKTIYRELNDAIQSFHIDAAALSFALKMLNLFGYGINLTPDGRKIKGVHIETGGLIYEGEPQAPDLDVKASTQLLKMIYAPYEMLKDIDQESIAKFKVFTLKYYQFHLQTTLKSLQ